MIPGLSCSRFFIYRGMKTFTQSSQESHQFSIDPEYTHSTSGCKSVFCDRFSKLFKSINGIVNRGTDDGKDK